MKRLLAIAFCALLFLGVTAAPSPAQVSQLTNALSGKGKKQTDPNDISNVDKDKIAHIEQMPEIQDSIQQEWDTLRRNDMQLAYGINLTENMGLSQDAASGDSFDRQRLYANPVVQSYVNHIGQRLVPKNSANVYTFRVLYDPIPKALTLSTGTIYLSTGLVSMLSSESEVAYVLAHEIAHVELRQAYLRIRDKHVAEELAKEKAEKEKMITDVGSMVMGAGLGGAMIPLRLGGLLGGSAGLATGMEVGHYFIHPQTRAGSLGLERAIEDDAVDDGDGVEFDGRAGLRPARSQSPLRFAQSGCNRGLAHGPRFYGQRAAYQGAASAIPGRATLFGGHVGRRRLKLRISRARASIPMVPISSPITAISSVSYAQEVQSGIWQWTHDLFAVWPSGILKAPWLIGPTILTRTSIWPSSNASRRALQKNGRTLSTISPRRCVSMPSGALSLQLSCNIPSTWMGGAEDSSNHDHRFRAS